ncbi:MAG: hypothetical protein WBA13_09265 [Microcoleaceae cyanobacterium]
MTPATWLALFLLLITYFTLGWTIFLAEISLLMWGFIIIGMASLVFCLTTPLENLKGPIMKWFRSNVGTFFAVIFAAFLLVVLATWIDIFFKIMLMLSAMILARTELQTIGVKHWLAFLILMSISLIGLVLGWVLHYYSFFGEHPSLY